MAGGTVQGSGSGDGGAGEPSAGQDPRRWKALSVTLVAGFMSLLDVSIVSVALPSIQADLGVSATQVQWVVSGYALTFGLALVPAGRLGDAFGRRRMFLVGLVAFVLCSAAAGAAPTIGLLIAARLLQGVAAGCLAPQNSALIQQLFRGAERGRAFGFFGATVAVSTAVGPVVGGALLALAAGPDGWRWIFYVNVPVGLVALVLAVRLLPHRRSRGQGRIDVIGVALLGAGALSLLLPLVQAEAGGITRLWWLFPVGVALLGLFVAWERRVVRTERPPVFDPRLISRTRGYGAGVAIATAYFIGFSGIWLVFALYFQTGLGWTPLQSGLAVTPFALGAAVSSVVAGRRVARYGRTVTVVGLAAVVLGLGGTALVIATVPASATGWAVAPALLVAGLGGGSVISPNITLALREVPVPMAGSAGGGLQTFQRFGAAIGTAALPGVYYVVMGAGRDEPTAAATALAVSVVTSAVALLLALADRRRTRHRDQAERDRRPAGGTGGERQPHDRRRVDPGATAGTGRDEHGHVHHHGHAAHA